MSRNALMLTLPLLLAAMACNLAGLAGEQADFEATRAAFELTIQAATVEAAQPAPATEAPALDPTSDGRAEFVYENVTLRYDPLLAGQISSELIAPVPEGEGPSGALPQILQLNIGSYALVDRFHAASIQVARVADYQAVSAGAAAQIESLSGLLAGRPDLTTLDSLPFLPLFNAAQVFTAEEAYIDFGSGSGIRYLTMYAQFFNLPNNQELFYTYQGITADGQYVVSFILPIEHPDLLPSTNNLTQEEWDAVAADYDNRLAAELAKFIGVNAARLNPSLESLDAFVAGLTVGG